MKLLLSLASVACLSVFATAQQYSGSTYIPTTAPKENIFSELTDKEENAVYKWLNQQRNSTDFPGRFDVYSVRTLAPNKADAVAYLDGSGPKPPRRARAALSFRGCYIKEYAVGPLPIDDTTHATLLNYVSGGGTVYPLRKCGEGVDTDRTPQGIQEPTSHLPGIGEDNQWSGRELPHDDKEAPVAILPEGARHEWDPKQDYVSWMDFSFYTSVGDTGVALHDIRFRGERIIYELGMQEALAHYAGVHESLATRAYFDAALGFRPIKLVPGYDCPSYATYSDPNKQYYGGYCLFEYPKDYPIQRHSGAHISVTKNIAFLLRSVSTIGNYDYQTNYEFYLDGSIQVIVRASGYIEGAGWSDNPADPEYGFHIRKHTSGAMHDHVLNFKLDLDINGTANSMFKTEFVPVSQTYPWSNGKTINTMKVERSFVTNEDEGRINWAENAAASYAVVNKDTPNPWGEYPGFKIYPSTGATVRSTIQNSSVFSNAMNWATHPLYVLQRKDNEPSSASELNNYNYEEPIVDFNDFFNGESLDQEDLVVYFNLGMHHMPDTYDLPNTVFTGAASGITIRPQNYLFSDASRDTRQQVRINQNGQNVRVNTFGANLPSGEFDLDSTNPDLEEIFGGN